MRITTDKNRVYVRECLKNKVYHSKSWMLYNDLKRFLKSPPEVWRNNDEYQLVIYWIDNKPVGVLLTVPWDIYVRVPYEGNNLDERIKNYKLEYKKQVQTQIYVKPQYRNKGIATALVNTAISELGIKKIEITYAGDIAICILNTKFPNQVVIKGEPEEYKLAKIKAMVETAMEDRSILNNIIEQYHPDIRKEYLI